MDSGLRTLRREPDDCLAKGRGARIAVHDEQRERAGTAAKSRCAPGRTGWTGCTGWTGRTGGTDWTGTPGMRSLLLLIEPSIQLRGAGDGLVPVVGREQPAVLTVDRTEMRQPPEPGPLSGALLGLAGAVRGQQHDLQSARAVQSGELSHHGTRQPHQPRTRPGKTEGPALAQIDGEGAARASAAAVRRADPYGQCVRMAGLTLPEPGTRPKGGQQDGGGIGAALAAPSVGSGFRATACAASRTSGG